MSSVSELYPVLSELSASRTNADAGESDDRGIPVINWPQVWLPAPPTYSKANTEPKVQLVRFASRASCV